MRRAMQLQAVLLALLLCGCYVSKTPFITAANADYPLKDGAHLAVYVPRGTGWHEDSGRVVRRVGDYYVYVVDGEAKPSPPFMLRRVGGTRYVLQVSDSSDPRKVSEYYYELIEFDGRTAIQYQGTCPARQEWVTRGLVDKIEDTSTARCLFSDFGKLATVLQEAAKNAAPEAKFVLTESR